MLKNKQQICEPRKAWLINLSYNYNMNWKNEARFTPRSFFVCRRICPCRGGMGYTSRNWNLWVKKKCWYLLTSARDRWCVFYPCSIFDPVMRSQRSNFREIRIFFQRVPCSIPDKMTCCFLMLIEYLWRRASRKGTTSPSPEQLPDGKRGQWLLLTLETVKGPNKLCENEPHIRS